MSAARFDIKCRWHRGRKSVIGVGSRKEMEEEKLERKRT